MSLYIGDSSGEASGMSKVYVGVNSKAETVKKIYVGVNGVAQLSWKLIEPARAAVVTYTGSKSDQQDQTINGVSCRLITLKSSGTFSIDRDLQCSVWLCGGGGNGRSASRGVYAGGGGAGAYCTSGNVNLLENVGKVATVGAAMQGSSFDSLIVEGLTDAANAWDGGSGGTGGGAAYNSANRSYGSAGVGDGLSKYPFGDTTSFYPHCAGGAGGTYTPRGLHLTDNVGCNGGSNGSDGSDTKGGTGGYKGGGNGKDINYSSGGAGSFYGGGGGGGATSENDNTIVQSYSSGGSGKSGVIYIAIPYDQRESVLTTNI